ncbi:MAG: hypothetical protein QMC11_05370 [Rhodospirillales bacterium]
MDRHPQHRMASGPGRWIIGHAAAFLWNRTHRFVQMSTGYSIYRAHAF